VFVYMYTLQGSGKNILWSSQSAVTFCKRDSRRAVLCFGWCLSCCSVELKHHGMICNSLRTLCNSFISDLRTDVLVAVVHAAICLRVSHYGVCVCNL